jgi:TRAP transporter TAXI family solute receptor
MQAALPRWLRFVLVLGAVLLASGVGFYAYRQLSSPKILTVATGAIDKDGTLLISAIAARLAASQSPIRLKVVEKDSMPATIKAFTAGEADLAIVRSDLGDMSSARTVALLAHGVLMIIVPPGQKIESMEDLKGKSVGIVGGQVNHRVAEVLDKEYNLTEAKVKWVDIPLEEVPAAIQTKKVAALLVVTPISEKFLTIIRSFFPRDPKRRPVLIPIDAAGAIAAVSREYETHDLPKGILRASPAMPDDDLTTLRVPIYLVANSKLSDDSVTALAKAVMEAKGSLTAQHPLASQISAPSTEKDAAIPIHPGAAAYFAGEEKTIFDKYGDMFFYASMLLGMVGSALAAVWKFVSSDSGGAVGRSLDVQLSTMSRRIRTAHGDELDQIENEIDDVLDFEIARSKRGETDAAALQIALTRLGHLIDQRRRVLQADHVIQH